MDEYFGISYLADGEDEWTFEQLEDWRLNNCPNGVHLFDEVLSVDSHYLHCDACGYNLPMDKYLKNRKKKLRNAINKKNKKHNSH